MVAATMQYTVPNEGTKAREVFDYLKSNRRWVSSTEILRGEIGGTDGTRRVRELRAAGLPIETRQESNNSRRVAYRMSKISK